MLYSREGITQGDPLAMAMFALATVPLINAVATPGTIQAWFADDAASDGVLQRIREWWDCLVAKGPAFGYFPNAGITYLLMKTGSYDEAVRIFKDTAVQITLEGRHYLGGALGTDAFVKDFMSEKVSDWTQQVQRLAKFASTQPQAAFAACTHGLISKWVYSIRVTLPFSEDLLQPLENAVSHNLIPALTGQPAPKEKIRALLALPIRLGGMGLVNPTCLPEHQQHTSLALTKPLVDRIKEQKQQMDMLQVQQAQVCLKRKAQQQRRASAKEEADKVIANLSSTQRRCAIAAQEKGTSSWLSAVPIERLGFVLHKGEFRDAIALRYSWPLHFAPRSCRCGEQFDVDHVLTCKHGGFHILRHNETRDLIAGLLSEVCTDVSKEPRLQPLSGERLPTSANVDDEARLDIRARGFWSSGHGYQDAFFDVRVFYPFASTYRNSKLPAVYRQHEVKKRLQYGRRVIDIEHGCFTPLVFTTGGGMAPEATTCMKRLASLLSQKREESYAVVMGWLRCSISFCLLRSSLACIRGSWKPGRTKEISTDNITEAAVESRLSV